MLHHAVPDAAPMDGGPLTTVASPAERVVDDGPTLVIQPSHGWAKLGLRELWRYRELLFFLTWRDVLIRYKQAVLGVAWAVLNPVLTMIVFTVVFNKLLGVPSGSPDLPYPVFLYAGLLPWQLFAGALGRSGTSLVGNAALITKVYFPRLVIPSSGVLATLPDFLISCVVLAILMAVYGVAPTWQVVFLPLFVLLALVTALGVSLWLSALNVLYRDVQYIIPFMVQLWMFVSPVFYPITKIDTYPEWAQVIYNLNPMTVVIGGFRWALLGQRPPNDLFWLSAVMVVVVFVGGLYYFRRMERVFADVV
jgi:lipopolysaccharide transport system permease protein